METGLEGKPIYYGAGAGVGMIVVAFLVGHFLFFDKMSKDIEKQGRRLAELQEKIAAGRAAERNLPQFKDEVRRLELELDKLLQILPSERRTDNLLRRVRSLAEQGDFDLLRFDPGEPASVSEFYNEWAISIRLEGTYHNLALFFDRIKRFSRIINIENLQVTPIKKSGTNHTIGASFIAKTFLAVETTSEDEEEF